MQEGDIGLMKAVDTLGMPPHYRLNLRDVVRSARRSLELADGAHHPHPVPR
ncbi:MAG: hypothetical protein U5L03_05855 [Burkholderiaceae bacterium]|nr:hypothetical protein [Burkholderiaceae bacterium]